MKTASERRRVGQSIDPLELSSLSHGTIRLPKAGTTHLQFRRFAGCPICNLHLRQFARGYAQLLESGVEVVAFFHSSRESMLPYQGSLPFPTVPDEERNLYRLFGVERSFGAVLHPKAAWAMVKGLARPSANPLAGGPDPNGLPADFLIDQDGIIQDLKYGAHADDHWSVEEVLDRVS